MEEEGMQRTANEMISIGKPLEIDEKKLDSALEKNLDDIKTVGILVGPEGGFEEDEISKLKEKGAHIITLGKRILRSK